MKTLLEDYERRLKTVLSELKKCELNIEKETRLATKASCYKTFIIELTKQLTLTDVVVPKGTCCEPISEGFYLGTSCPECNKPFRQNLK